MTSGVGSWAAVCLVTFVAAICYQPRPLFAEDVAFGNGTHELQFDIITCLVDGSFSKYLQGSYVAVYHLFVIFLPTKAVMRYWAARTFRSRVRILFVSQVYFRSFMTHLF
jgi:hypothetical protein